jgi:hypothetical protein
MTTAFAPKSKLMIVTACTTTAHHRNIVGDRMKAIFGTSVLIVEGQRAIFQLIQELLIDLGLRDIQHASDGMSALRKLAQSRYFASTSAAESGREAAPRGARSRAPSGISESK